jgi:hypothetical protein
LTLWISHMVSPRDEQSKPSETTRTGSNAGVIDKRDRLRSIRPNDKGF